MNDFYVGFLLLYNLSGFKTYKDTTVKTIIYGRTLKLFIILKCNNPFVVGRKITFKYHPYDVRSTRLVW